MQENKGPRVYPLDNMGLTQEQMAVVFAMTSRSPDPFDTIAQRVSEERATDFHERWVLDYGHASVAEHAVIHLAVENISRVACDALEDNRLASYTEKSSRYQVIQPGDYHAPQELSNPDVRQYYRDTINQLFNTYGQLIEKSTKWLNGQHPKQDNETQNAYNLRIRRMATDACRNVLPAAILTNVGLTANARTLEHAISKLLSSDLDETIALGHTVRDQARQTVPTLVKYADYNPYLAGRQLGNINHILPHDAEYGVPAQATLVDCQDDPTVKLATALLYRNSAGSYADLNHHVRALTLQARADIVADACRDFGRHDQLPREFETATYSFEFTIDYGAMREFNRHRMMTRVHRPLTTRMGTRMPTLMTQAGLEAPFQKATAAAEELFNVLENAHGHNVAQYAVSHAHLQPVLATMNLRQLAHIIALRTSPRAHEAISAPVAMAASLAQQTHPELFQAIKNTNPNR